MCRCQAAAGQIGKIIVSGTAETELHFDGLSVRAVRADRLERILEKKAGTRKAAAKLERRSVAGQRVSWQPMKRLPPQSNEIEIEVQASGLNFRDLMWSLGLLPDDVLEDGLTGPTLGIECAGTVSRLGPSVKGLAAGDRVMAFADRRSPPTSPFQRSAQGPGGMLSEAAATIPVAFFTAYYSLITLASAEAREWVLIHGGAGAVGMAAIQIAQSRGARVIATAGSPAKRDLLRALGVAARSRFALDDLCRRRAQRSPETASMSSSTASPARRWSAPSPACVRSAASSSSANATTSPTRILGCGRSAGT